MNWVVLIILSVVFLGFRAIVFKKALQKHHTITILFLGATLTTILSLISFNKIDFVPDSTVFILLIIKSAIIALAWFFLYESLKNLPISTVEPLKNLSPIFLLIFSFFLLGEAPSWMQFVGIIVLIFGAYALELEGFHNFLSPLKLFKSKYFLFIVLNLVGVSISAVMDKVILKSVNVYTMMFWYFFLTTIFYGATIIYKKDHSDIKGSIKDAWMWIVLTAVLLFAGDFVYFYALTIPGVLVSLVIPIRRLSTVIATFVGGKVFHEKHVWYKLGVCLFLIAGFLLIVL
jgi:drug/metabolite transporter (DMT)-like permease